MYTVQFVKVWVFKKTENSSLHAGIIKTNLDVTISLIFDLIELYLTSQLKCYWTTNTTDNKDRLRRVRCSVLPRSACPAATLLVPRSPQEKVSCYGDFKMQFLFYAIDQVFLYVLVTSVDYSFVFLLLIWIFCIIFASMMNFL